MARVIEPPRPTLVFRRSACASGSIENARKPAASTQTMNARVAQATARRAAVARTTATTTRASPASRRRLDLRQDSRESSALAHRAGVLASGPISSAAPQAASAFFSLRSLNAITISVIPRRSVIAATHATRMIALPRKYPAAQKASRISMIPTMSPTHQR